MQEPTSQGTNKPGALSLVPRSLSLSQGMLPGRGHSALLSSWLVCPSVWIVAAGILCIHQ